MNIKRILLAATCLITLSSNVACKSGTDNSGIDFTYVGISHDTVGMSLSIKFNYEGTDLKVLWGDGVEDNLNYHTFDKECTNKEFFISGNITSISFCDESGTMLEEGNYYITSIIFSKTITTISQKAFYLIPVTNVFIPTSVKTIGEKAFANLLSDITFFCGATNKPSEWDNAWDLNIRLIDVFVWGVVFYNENSCLYALLNYGGSKTASALLCYNDGIDLKINIPNTVSNAGNNYKVTSIAAGFSDLIRNNLIEITIPDSVGSIYSGAFMECSRLNKININSSTSNLNVIDANAFMGTSIKDFTVPKNVSIIVHDSFSFCEKLGDVYLTEYSKPSQIAYCASSSFNSGIAITFHYSNGLKEEDFYKNGWPKAGERYIWKNESTSLSCD